MAERILRNSDIPQTLWRSEDDLLFLPEPVSVQYRSTLEAEDLLSLALAGGDENGPVGGVTEDAARAHFAHRFAASAARTQLAVLDPKNSLRNVSDLFMKAFSGGRIGLLDVPCGAGAASLDILATVASLRAQGIIPRQPLEVQLVAGDISDHARQYACDMLAGVRPNLLRQGVTVRDRLIKWDVLDAESTTEVLHSWMEWAHGCREYFVVVANFSAFLEHSGNFSRAGPQLDEVFRWAAQRRSVVMWLEPQTRKAAKGLWPRLLAWFRKKLPRLFSRLWDLAEGAMGSSSKYNHPIREGHTPPVRLGLMRLDASDP